MGVITAMDFSSRHFDFGIAHLSDFRQGSLLVQGLWVLKQADVSADVLQKVGSFSVLQSSGTYTGIANGSFKCCCKTCRRLMLKE